MDDGKNPESDEVQIEIEGKEFTCSRSELCQNSDYFHALFNGEFMERDKKTIIIQDVPEVGFRGCLDLIKDENMNFESVQLLDMLHCSWVLQFAKIKQYCIDRFVNHMPLEFCLDIWHLTDLLEIHPLCEMAKCLAFLSFNKLKDMECFLKMNIKQLHSYLANELIHCETELDIFRAGMKWWHENSIKLEESDDWNSEDTTKYLYTILTCVDFKSCKKSDLDYILTFTEIKNDREVSNILMEISELMDNPQKELKEGLEKRARSLYYNPKSRNREKMLCTYMSGYSLEVSLGNFKTTGITILHYDTVSKGMKTLLKEEIKFCTNEYQSFFSNGCIILPYNQNLIFFGSKFSPEYMRKYNNTDVWMYHNFKQEWKFITEMPEERSDFNACIVDDKLIIVGGKTTYNDRRTKKMMMYDFAENCWFKRIYFPYWRMDFLTCEYKKKLLMIPKIAGNQNAFIFDPETWKWTKQLIEFPPRFAFDFKKISAVFCKGESIFVKGSHLLEMQLHDSTLKVMNCTNCDEPDRCKINFVSNNNLYMISFKDNMLLGYRTFQLHFLDLNTKKYELLLETTNIDNQIWNLRRNCFMFFHYSLITKDVKCISELQI